MIKVQLAQEKDILSILKMEKSLGDYLGDDIQLTSKDLHQTLFVDHLCFCLLAFDDDQPVGMALCYYTFSTMLSKKGIYLLDLFVEKDARGKGVGKALFQALAKHAIKHDCKRIDWDCLKWNTSSLAIYHHLNGEVRDDHDFFRLNEKQINDLANNR